MSKFVDREGDPGTIKPSDLSVPGCWSAQISHEQRGTAMEVEVAIGVHGVFPLPLGIEREDRCE